MTRSLLVLELIVLAIASAHGRCMHDALVSERALTLPAREPRATLAYEGGGGAPRRHLKGLPADSPLQPIRIVPIFIGLNASTNGTAYIKELVYEALAQWSSLLSVEPVSGGLFAAPACATYLADGTGASCSTFASDTACTGFAGDSYISFTSAFPQYLSPAIVAGITPSSSLSPTAAPSPAPVGLVNADHGLFVTAVSTKLCGRFGAGTSAYAVGCQRDQYDRPTWSRINICPALVGSNPNPTAKLRASNLAAISHELAHVLGFSSESFVLFRNPIDGKPLTPRSAVTTSNVDTPYQLNPKNGTCAGITLNVAAPSTIAYGNERGMSCSWDGLTASTSNIPYGSKGKTPLDCVARMVTPRVAAAAADFFACPGLVGSELENQDTTNCVVQSSHWESRTLNTELMSAFPQHTSLLSPITLAAFEDSGWYVANFSGADTWREGLDYGYHAGCAFARDTPCSSTNVGPYTPNNLPWYFDAVSNPLQDCNDAAGCYAHIPGSSFGAVCTTDHKAWGTTSVGIVTPPPPSHFKYFPSDPRGGSIALGMDYCPAVDVLRSCEEPPLVRGPQYEVYAPGSICLRNTLTLGGSGNSIGLSSNGASCFSITCSNDPLTGAARVSINVPNQTAIPCGSNATVTIEGYSGSIACPNATTVCSVGQRWEPTFTRVLPIVHPAVPTPFPKNITPAPPPALPIVLSVAALIFVALVIFGIWFHFHRKFLIKKAAEDAKAEEEAAAMRAELEKSRLASGSVRLNRSQRATRSQRFARGPSGNLRLSGSQRMSLSRSNGRSLGRSLSPDDDNMARLGGSQRAMLPYAVGGSARLPSASGRAAGASGGPSASSRPPLTFSMSQPILPLSASSIISPAQRARQLAAAQRATNVTATSGQRLPQQPMLTRGRFMASPTGVSGTGSVVGATPGGAGGISIRVDGGATDTLSPPPLTVVPLTSPFSERPPTSSMLSPAEAQMLLTSPFSAALPAALSPSSPVIVTVMGSGVASPIASKGGATPSESRFLLRSRRATKQQAAAEAAAITAASAAAAAASIPGLSSDVIASPIAQHATATPEVRDVGPNTPRKLSVSGAPTLAGGVVPEGGVLHTMGVAVGGEVMGGEGGTSGELGVPIQQLLSLRRASQELPATTAPPSLGAADASAMTKAQQPTMELQPTIPVARGRAGARKEGGLLIIPATPPPPPPAPR